MAEREDGWLAGQAPWPFWGRGGTPKRIELEAERAFRTTERDAALQQTTAPKSIFQLVGSGQVGPGSIRGMPILHRLREAGFSVWPFDEARWPLVIELYPPNRRGQQAQPGKSRSAPAAVWASATRDDH
jgi:hypothetical protein